MKYVNNDGNCYESDSTELDEIFEKAQSLVHFSYEFTEKKMMLLDLQGSKYKLRSRNRNRTAARLLRFGRVLFLCRKLDVDVHREIYFQT